MTTRKTILYAEDDSILRQMMALYLNHLGYRPILAVDGRDALEKYLASREEIRLLLLDMMMPGMTGAELLDEIRKTDPGIKALVCTAAPEAARRAFAGREYGVDIVTKPYDFKLLAAKLRCLLKNV